MTGSEISAARVPLASPTAFSNVAFSPRLRERPSIDSAAGLLKRSFVRVPVVSSTRPARRPVAGAGECGREDRLEIELDRKPQSPPLRGRNPPRHEDPVPVDGDLDADERVAVAGKRAVDDALGDRVRETIRVSRQDVLGDVRPHRPLPPASGGRTVIEAASSCRSPG